MARKVENVVTEKVDWPGNEDTVRSKHPAFGQIIVSRISHDGSVRLYGTALVTHPQTIQITIKRSERQHDLSRDWFFSGKELISIELSSAQFVDMITHMNIGTGVPCTLRHVNCEEVPEINYDDEVESERIKSKFKAYVRDKSKDLDELLHTAADILSKKTILKSDRENLLDMLHKFKLYYKSNIPFVMDQFEEAATKIITEAKKEVESFIHTVAETTGLQVLKNMTIGEQIRLLDGNKKDSIEEKE